MSEFERFNEPQTTLPEGLASFIVAANNAEQLSRDEWTRTLDNIAEVAKLTDSLDDDKIAELDAETLAYVKEVDQQRHRYAWSFMKLVVSRSYSALARQGLTRLEDYIQAGVEGLYEAIDLFALADERRAFVPFATIYIDQALRAQFRRDRFNTELGKNVVSAMYAYLKAEREIKEGSLDSMDLERIGKEIRASKLTMLGGMAAVATFRRGYEFPETYERSNLEDEYQETVWGSANLSLQIEKALLFLSSSQRQCIEQLFGLLPDMPMLTMEEIAEARGVDLHSVRGQKDKALRILRDVLTDLKAHGTNFDNWTVAHKHFFSRKKRHNVLTYLYEAGLPIPEDKTVSELTIIAMRDLTSRNVPEVHKQIVADMYGLYSGERLDLAQLVEKYGYSDGRFAQIFKAVMRAESIGVR